MSGIGPSTRDVELDTAICTPALLPKFLARLYLCYFGLIPQVPICLSDEDEILIRIPFRFLVWTLRPYRHLQNANHFPLLSVMMLRIFIDRPCYLAVRTCWLLPAT